MNKVKNITINVKETIINSLKVIDQAAKGIVYVIDNKSKLLGTLTDGDIRRGLIRGIALDDCVESIMNRTPIKIEESASKEKQKQLMIKKAIRELPIVDSKGHLVDTISLSELLLPKGKENFVVVMAGGLGTRLKELTKEIPKPMLNLGDRPIMQHIIEQFKVSGFNKFLVSVNYKSEIIENYFQDGSNYGCTIEYLKEKERLGTAGAITLASNRIKEDFFVINGDIYCTVNFNKIMDFHKKNQNDVTIVSVKKSINVPYGVLSTSGNDVEAIIEKPNYDFLISGGIYCLSTAVIELIPKGQYYEITELFEQCIKKGLKVKQYMVDDYWIDIGRMEDYNKINNDIYDLVCCSEAEA